MDIKIEQLAFAYPTKKIFCGINAELAPGSLHYLAGCNGTGKSTLLKLLCGFLKPLQGSILLGGKPLEKFSGSERARIMGVLQQDIKCELDFTVREMITITAAGRFSRLQMLPQTFLKRLEENLVLFELEKISSMPFCNLSGGEKQRTLLAGLWTLEPQIMLLDEPTAALDPAWRNRLIAMLEEYAQTHTVLAITHDLELLARANGNLWMLDQANNFYSGQAHSMLTGELLSKIYNTPAQILTDPAGRKHIYFA